jgi:lysozyme family protein
MALRGLVMPNTYESHRDRYSTLLSTCLVHESFQKQIKVVLDRFERNIVRYDLVSKYTNVPAILIAAIHSKEASGNFFCNLHNGQKLHMVTTIVPVGRGPFKTWEESAIDALGMKKSIIASLNIPHGEAWTMQQMLWFAEKYNGFGFLRHNINSAYLWTGTSLYDGGGFKSDGNFDRNYLSKNVGVAPILLANEKK